MRRATGPSGRGPRGARNSGSSRAKLVENGGEAVDRGALGALNVLASAFAGDDQIDRPVVEMEAAVRAVARPAAGS